MLEFLNIGIQVSIMNLLIIAIVLMLFSQIPFIYWWLENRKWNPEGKIFSKARKEGFPIIEKVAMSGFIKFEIGEKDVKGDPVFKIDRTTNQGVHLDPRLSSGGAPREFIAGGAELMHYSTSVPIAQSSRNAMAMSSIIKHVRKEYPYLAFLPDYVILEHVNLSRADQAHDCANLVENYDLEGKIDIPESVLSAFHDNTVEQIKDELLENGENREPTEDEIETIYQQNLTAYKKSYHAKSLVETFQKIQDESVHLPVESDRYFSYNEAFQNNSLSTFAADLQNYLQIIELIAEKKHSLTDKDKLMYFAMVIIIILIGGALAYKMAG